MGYRYIGSKARIVDEIIDLIGMPSKENFTLVDAFSGTGVVAERAAMLGWTVEINDMMKYATILSHSRLLSKYDVTFELVGGYDGVIDFLNSLKPIEGFFWREYSPKSLDFIGLERRYFIEENAGKIDAMVKTIHNWKRENLISENEFILLMGDLISSVNQVANIAGTYGCFLSKWTPQALKPIELIRRELHEKVYKFESFNMDVYDFPYKSTDIVYLDPPYTKRQYASYYHILETIVEGDEPLVEGVSGLRPWKNNASVFCYKTKALKALVELMTSIDAKKILLSYSNDGHIVLDELVKELNKVGSVKIIKIQDIGRYRPNKVAVKNKSEVSEYLIEYERNGDKENG